MVVIGLTGGIGAGKSEVSRILAGLGAVVIDTALLGHEAYAPGGPAHDAVVDAFGGEVLLPDGHVDRTRLGDIVFGDPAELQRLNAIMRPAIGALLEERLAQARERGAAVAVIDSATLLEAGWASLADEVWLTTAPQEAVHRRLQRRSGLSEAAIAQRRAAQLTDEERRKSAHAVIANDGSLADLQAAVRALWAERIQAKVGSNGAVYAEAERDRVSDASD